MMVLFGRIKYVGRSGYPMATLCDLAEMILERTGEPLDAVMSYANLTLQNTRLSSVALPRQCSPKCLRRDNQQLAILISVYFTDTEACSRLVAHCRHRRMGDNN